ncbi:MAG: hypothetical protein HOC23_02705 [Halieaceae bacterium]|nr:hypothetical protein [Halieaceae bacterium]
MAGLSLDTIPPIHIPFRFFNTAPWMGLFASLILLWGGDRVFYSQWNPELLGITHLLTLGFMAMVMLGAMFQLVPVISGELIPGGGKVATCVHSMLLIGLLLLVAGFYWQEWSLFRWAIPLLLLAFLVFIAALASLLLRRIGGGDSIYSIRFAALSLVVTLALGILRAAQYMGLGLSLPLMNITDIHIAWGLGGWVLLLVMGASYQVIPMFHVTPNVPTPLARAMPSAVFLSLLLLTVAQHPLLQALAMIIWCSAAFIYGVFCVRLLNRRKRKIPDVTARFWHLALTCLMGTALLLLGLYFGGHLVPEGIISSKAPVVIGILMIYGFAISVIMGMLQKIVPFLSFLHLQRRCMTSFELLKTLPHMGEIVPAPRSRWQFRIHLAALLMVLATAMIGAMVEVAAILMAVDFGWLGFTLASATHLYIKTSARIELANVPG